MTRHTITLFAVLLAMPSICRAIEPHHEPTVFRHTGVDAAWQAAQKSRRPMLLYISSADCKYCTKMLRDTYSHPQIAAALTQSCEPVAVMREENLPLIKRLKIRAYPTTVVVGADGKEVVRVEGYQPPQKFAELMFGPPRQAKSDVRPVSAVTPAR